MIYATSSNDSENYIWKQTQTGWNLQAKGFPSSDCTRDPSKSISFTGSPTSDDAVPPYLRAISHYSWHDKSAMVFDNGTRIEKRGDHAFVIVNAGGANEKIFTILYGNTKSYAALSSH